MNLETLKPIIEAALLASHKPLDVNQLMKLFEEERDVPAKSDIRKALAELESDCTGRGVELKETASGFRYRVRQEQAQIAARLWDERPPRYTRALLETLALIAYRQPITRAEIEDVRGVAVSSNIIRTLSEREWVHVIGHKETPGRPALYATTKTFLDYFGLKSLDELPTLKELQDLDAIEPELDLASPDEVIPDATVIVVEETSETLEENPVQH